MSKNPVSGSKLIYPYRFYKNRASEAAKRLGLVSENGKSISISSDTTQTKDGVIRSVAEPEIEITITSLLPENDEMVAELEEGALNKELLEIWEADLSSPGTTSGKYKGFYYQGNITAFEKNSPADGNVEISITVGVNGKGVAGDVTVSDTMAAEALYVFSDTTKGAA